MFEGEQALGDERVLAGPNGKHKQLQGAESIARCGPRGQYSVDLIFVDVFVAHRRRPREEVIVPRSRDDHATAPLG